MDDARRDPHPLLAAVAFLGALVLLGIGLKLVVDAGGPLWLDEGWTLGIVDRPTAAGFAEQLRLDVNPPLYFLLLRGWTAAAGLSDAALRAPSTLFAVLAGLTPLLAGPVLPRVERWSWAAVLGLLPFSVYFAQEARGYALLLWIEAGVAVAYLRLVDRPSRGRAALWCGLSCLALLTHHHALVLAGLQGAALVARLRLRVLRLWPAALLFAPWAAWTAVQAPRVAQFARPEFAWYARLTPADAAAVADGLTGGALPAAAALALLGFVLRRRFAGRSAHAPPVGAPEALTALTSVAAAAVLLLIGLARPSFTGRYLVPEAPGVALALVAGLRAAAPALAPALQAGLAAVVAVAAVGGAVRSDTAGRRAFSIERASADLVAAGAPAVAFLWDNPTDGVLAPAERDALADAFFVRAGRPVRTEGLHLRPGEDPNLRAAAAAAPALVWMYDLRVPRTAAVRFPPRLEAVDPRLSCRRYAGGALGVVACVRAPLRWPT